jgi:GTP cyclohydrolase I
MDAADSQSVESAIEGILECIGENISREGLVETPERVARAYGKLFEGYAMNVEDQFTSFSSDGCDELVVLKDIEFYSTCEHHMLPFFGRASVSYLPGTKVIGVSKLARILDIYSRRMQIQERIGMQVVNALMEHLDCKAAACIIEAQHFCMMARGVQKQNSVMVTSALTGVFKEQSQAGLAARAELMSLIK